MTRLAVHVIVEHCGDRRPFGCAYIRDLLPLGHPANRDLVELSWGFDYAPADVVVVERTFKPGAKVVDAERLAERARRDGARIAYTLDDDLLDAEALPVATRAVVRFFCREADGIVVSTAVLADRVRALARRVALVPNAVDERLFFGPEPGTVSGADPRRPLAIGFMGTLTHDRDLMMVVQPLREVLRFRQRDVELQLVGGVADPALLGLFDGLPVRQLHVPVDSIEYPAFVRWMRRHARWDIGIAPLRDGRFTRAKSDIKFLDYAALGVAGVYSDVPAYAGTVRHGGNGLLVVNAPEAWAAALERLLVDGSLRRSLATAAREHVAAERTLARRATDWHRALASFV